MWPRPAGVVTSTRIACKAPQELRRLSGAARPWAVPWLIASDGRRLRAGCWPYCSPSSSTTSQSTPVHGVSCFAGTMIGRGCCAGGGAPGRRGTTSGDLAGRRRHLAHGDPRVGRSRPGHRDGVCSDQEGRSRPNIGRGSFNSTRWPSSPTATTLRSFVPFESAGLYSARLRRSAAFLPPRRPTARFRKPSPSGPRQLILCCYGPLAGRDPADSAAERVASRARGDTLFASVTALSLTANELTATFTVGLGLSSPDLAIDNGDRVCNVGVVFVGAEFGVSGTVCTDPDQVAPAWISAARSPCPPPAGPLTPAARRWRARVCSSAQLRSSSPAARPEAVASRRVRRRAGRRCDER